MASCTWSEGWSTSRAPTNVVEPRLVLYYNCTGTSRIFDAFPPQPPRALPTPTILPLSSRMPPAKKTIAKKVPAKKAPAPAKKAPAKKSPATGKQKMPRRPSNMDDDEAVERYKERLDALEAEEKKAAALAANAGKDRDTIVAEVASAIKTVVQNVADGHCPQPIGKAYVYVQQPSHLEKRHCVSVVLNPALHGPNGFEYDTPDARLLNDICGDFDSEIDLLGPLFGKGRTMEAAVPGLVAGCVKEGRATPADTARLTKKWSAWWKGVPWSAAQLSGSNRPSLGSWIGYPWDVQYVMEKESQGCGVTAGLSAAAANHLSIDFELGPPASFVPASVVPCFVPVWSKGGSVPSDCEAVLRTAMAKTEAVIAASKGKA